MVWSHFPIRVCFEAEGSRWEGGVGKGKGGGEYLDIQIWSQNMTTVILSNDSILNGGLTPGRYLTHAFNIQI